MTGDPGLEGLDPGPLSAQARRELLVGAWLDITLAQFSTRLSGIDVDAVSDAVSDYAGRYISALQDAAREDGDPASPQLQVQAIACMADDTLLEAVRLFGTVPPGAAAA